MSIRKTIAFMRKLEGQRSTDIERAMSRPPIFYIIRFPATKIIKFGRTNNIYVRVSRLSGVWGIPDYDDSYVVNIQKKHIGSLENAFKVFLDFSKTELVEGEGHTEIRHDYSLNHAKKLLEIFLEWNGYSTQLTKLCDLDTRFLIQKSQIV